MDASHRGGEPGFVQVENATRLVFPDYAGNNHFNTIGNLILDSRVGLLFVDFENGSLLQISGRAHIDWDSGALTRFPGVRRLVACEIEEVVELRSALPLRWSAPTEAVRTLRLVEKVCESEEVVSFVFAARDGGPLAEFDAGQHLPIEIELPGHTRPVARTYSISNGPGEGRYRISVKREPYGVVSNYLHDEAQVGAFVNTRAPAGEFKLEKSDRPVVLISAGVGVTPMLSMLQTLMASPLSRSVHFVHGARDGAHHVLAEEVRLLVGKHPCSQAHFAYSRPRAEDVLGTHYQSSGRINVDVITQLNPLLDADFYLCGPTKFMSDLQLGLLQRGVSENRLHAETFGPIA